MTDHAGALNAEVFETKAWAAVIALFFIVSKPFEQIQTDILEGGKVIEWDHVGKGKMGVSTNV